MQNRGFVRVFTVCLVLAALYSLSFTYFTSKANREADKYAKEMAGDDNIAYAAYQKQYLDSLSRQEDYYNFFWLRKFSLNDCHQHELNLGLDLKGGMNVTLQISTRDLIKNLSSDGDADTMLVNTLNLADKYEQEAGETYITAFGKAFEKLYPNNFMRTMFVANEDMMGKINYNSTNEEVLDVLEAEETSAIENTFNVLRTRIDRFGVTQPNIQNVGGGRILVELPGVEDRERVRELLESSAQLEFWETYNNAEVYQILFSINNTLAALNKVSESKEDVAAEEVAKKDSAENTELSLKEQIQQSDSAAVDSAQMMAQNAEEFKKANPFFAYLTPNVDREGRLGYGPIVGYASSRDVAMVDSILAMPEIKTVLLENAPELKLTWSKKADNGIYTLIALKDVDLDGHASLEGDVVVDSRPEFSNQGGGASVRMVMNSEGAKEWKRLTKENIGRSVAIVLDGYVYSYPTVQGEIGDGISSITGDFTIAQATDLANILKSGKLSARAHIMNAEFVGPSLGKESISTGILSFVFAFILVLVYMIFYYRKAGFVASAALLLNLFLIFGVLASLGAVLTLSGIAGIVLTLGMAVDANVIIYERIREELASGKAVRLSIADGFKNAYSAIIDGQVTTFLTGLILFIFGTGPIQGFATTLLIGILTSLFCGIFITRLIFERFLDKKKEISFDSNLTRGAFKNVNIDFIKSGKITAIISGIMVVGSLLSIAVRGFDVGVDFAGGRSFVIELQGERKVEAIAESLAVQFDGAAPEVKTYGATDIKVTTNYKINEKSDEGHDISAEVEEKLFNGMKSFLGEDVTLESFKQNNLKQSDMVGPTIANDIIYGAIVAIIIALICMFLYIFVRFSKWQYGVGAVVALFHDTIIVIGVYSILYGIVPFSLEIGQTFVAAILTIIGYSINDTVVVFDRIREFTREYPKRGTKMLFNQGINSTVSRTINTSMTTFVTLLIMFIFGADAIKGFVFSMAIGVIIGTYSSLFVASPVSYALMKKNEGEEA
ncbi:MAG: protein translocase subunit SecDF [Bacteroidales bacterium]|nr:protein translocase subunit SecDF [Bacteroidales bacterium]